MGAWCRSWEAAWNTHSPCQSACFYFQLPANVHPKNELKYVAVTQVGTHVEFQEPGSGLAAAGTWGVNQAHRKSPPFKQNKT